ARETTQARRVVPGGQTDRSYRDHLPRKGIEGENAATVFGPGIAAEGHAGQANPVVPLAVGVLRGLAAADPRVSRDVVRVHVTAAVAAVTAAPDQDVTARGVEGRAAPGAGRRRLPGITQRYPLVDRQRAQPFGVGFLPGGVG